MASGRTLKIDQLPGFIRGLAGEMDAAARIAGDEALKTAQSWMIAYVRNRKAVVPKHIKRALKKVKPRSGTHFADMRWELRAREIPLPMAAYPHSLVPGLGGGVKVEINKGQPTFWKHAFLAKVKAGTPRSRAEVAASGGRVALHEGIFLRTPWATSQPADNAWGRTTLPIKEKFSTSIADVLRDGLVKQEIQERAHEVYAETFARVMENGVAKNLAAKWAAKRR